MVASKLEFEKAIKEMLFKASPFYIVDNKTLTISSIYNNKIVFKISLTDEDFDNKFTIHHKDSDEIISGKEYFAALVQNLYMKCDVIHNGSTHIILITLELI